MAHILFQDGKRIGPVEDWSFQQNPPVYKNVLGKTVLASKPNTQCTFTSPKAIKKVGQFVIVEEKKMRFVLTVTRIKDGTFVTATVEEEQSLVES